MILPLGATALGSLALTLWTARDLPSGLSVGARGTASEWAAAARSASWPESLPDGWHSRCNPTPARLDWTNRGTVFSSMRSLAASSTNQSR